MPWYRRLLHVIKQIPCYVLLFLFPFFSSCCPWSRDVSLYMQMKYTFFTTMVSYINCSLKMFNIRYALNFGFLSDIWWSRSWPKSCSLVCATMAGTIEPMHIHCVLLHDIPILHYSVRGRSSTSCNSLDRYSYCSLDCFIHPQRHRDRYIFVYIIYSWV